MCSPECQFGQMCGSMEDCTAGLVCNDGVCTTPEDMDGGVGTHDSGSGGGGDGGGGMRGFVGTIIATAGISDYQVTATFAAKANAPATSCDGGPVYGSCCWQAAGATAPAPTYPPIDIGTLKVTDGSSTLATISAGSDDTYSVDSSSDSSLSWGSGDTLAFAGSGSSVYTSFSGSVTTPSAPSVNTIQPDEDGGTVSITMPIPVSWGAGSNKQEIVVNMAIYPAEGGMTSTGSIICSAKDSDGSLTIPASALEANAAKGDKATVLVSRVVASDTIVEGGVVSFQAVAQSQQQITLGP
jgi:hypothetical protein